MQAASARQRIVRWIAASCLALASLFAVAVTGIYVASEYRLRKVYRPTVRPIAIPTGAEAIARGEHLVKSVASCTLCHGEDLGGSPFADMGPIGAVSASNLTRGRGGVGAAFTDEDWIRALRHGVHRDGTSLMIMPSEAFRHFNDDDVGVIVAYVKQVPAVDREVPPSHLRLLGRALLVAGRLDILVAPKTLRYATWDAMLPRPTAEYGRYLADVSGCHGCHGPGLSGGRVAGPPGLPPAANLTPEGLATWTENDFVRVMRTGQRPDGTTINEVMPWRNFATMSEDELRALWLYLRSVPPRAFGV